jgi:DNA-binding NtrC family response regulator
MSNASHIVDSRQTRNGSRGDDSSGCPDARNRVLLVDDEEAVAEMASIVLEEAGYVVEHVGTGAQAIARVEAAGDRFCVVLLDLGLPDIGGARVLERIRSVRPGLRVVVCSGGRSTTPPGAADVLPKPYDFDALLSAVRGPVVGCES